MTDTIYQETGRSDNYTMSAVWPVHIEGTHNDSTGVQVPVLVLLVAVVTRKSTKLHLK